MAGRGGYQAPARPAAASAPGALSRRTDGSPWHPNQPVRTPTGMAYGEAGELRNLQQQAPLSNGPAPAPAQSAGGGGAAPQGGPSLEDLMGMATPMGAPTQRPDEPVTAGAAAGPGPGPEALNLPSPVAQAHQSALDYVTQIAQSSNNPAVQFLAQQIQGRY